jgi:hypothetical protein
MEELVTKAEAFALLSAYTAAAWRNAHSEGKYGGKEMDRRGRKIIEALSGEKPTTDELRRAIG